ncbi:TPA: hypothetical protein ACP2GW_005052, partial [Escherichia coli]
LAIKGVKCQDTRPAFPMVWRIRELNTTVPDQHDPMSWRLKGLMPRYATSLPMAWRLRGLNATVPDQLASMVWRLWGLNPTVPDQQAPWSLAKGEIASACRQDNVTP